MTANIAVITQGYRSAGGVQTVARWIVEQLRADECEVRVFDAATAALDPHSRLISRPTTWLRRSLVARDPEERDVYAVGANGAEIEFLRYVARKELTRRLRTFDVIVVVAGGPSLAGLAARAGRPLVLQIATFAAWERRSQLQSTVGVRRFWRSVMTRIVTRFCEPAGLRAADHILVETQHMAAAVAKLTDADVRVAPPGVDTTRFRPAQYWSPDRPILCIGRLAEPRKGLDRIIRMYAAVREALPSAPRLILAGRGNLPPDLIALIHKLDLTAYVELQTDVATEDLPVLYRHGSIFVQASHEEGLGIAVIEAMASGLPVVATETVGTATTVVDGSTGFLISQESDVPVAMAARVIEELTVTGSAHASAARERATHRFDNRYSYQPFRDALRDASPTRERTK